MLYSLFGLGLSSPRLNSGRLMFPLVVLNIVGSDSDRYKALLLSWAALFGSSKLDIPKLLGMLKVLKRLFATALVFIWKSSSLFLIIGSS